MKIIEYNQLLVTLYTIHTHTYCTLSIHTHAQRKDLVHTIEQQTKQLADLATQHRNALQSAQQEHQVEVAHMQHTMSMLEEQMQGMLCVCV